MILFHIYIFLFFTIILSLFYSEDDPTAYYCNNIISERNIVIVVLICFCLFDRIVRNNPSISCLFVNDLFTIYNHGAAAAVRIALYTQTLL